MSYSIQGNTIKRRHESDLKPWRVTTRFACGLRETIHTTNGSIAANRKNLLSR